MWLTCIGAVLCVLLVVYCRRMLNQSAHSMRHDYERIPASDPRYVTTRLMSGEVVRVSRESVVRSSFNNV